MKYSIQILSIIIFIALISCAKQSTPMGGPKDEDPPKLMSISPENESLNTKPSVIELLFDEYVKVENPNKSIIITPRIKKDEMEVTALKNRVVIKLNQELEDSTTYVFNFQKSITDITESNVPENLKLVFSTGPEIDSLTFSGNVAYTFPQKEKKMKDVLVGLYTKEDTTNILTAPPYYIGTADTAGNFTLTNIKEGEYLAYAWHDDNNSLKVEEKSEAYSFLGDTILIDRNISGVQFYLDKSNLSEFKVNRSSPTGSNFDIVLSKFPLDITLEAEDLGEKLFFRRNERTLRFYHTEMVNDSLPVQLNLKDSVGFAIDTLIYAKFEESERNKESLEVNIEGQKNFVDILKAEFKFNKPVTTINYDSLLIKYDSASIVPIKQEWLSFEDSLMRTRMVLKWKVPDTLSIENFIVYAGDSTFIDVESQFNKDKKETAFRRLKKETLAEELKITVNTDELPLIVQVLNKREELMAEQYLTESNVATFRNIEASTYLIRAIVDSNKNKRWDTHNMLENRQAERVYYLENPNDNNNKETTVRGGWTLEVPIQPTKPMGISKKTIPEDDEMEELEKDINLFIEELMDKYSIKTTVDK
ncbi:Ig-like domain-containing domain [Mongoliibacter ruber]|uniref:Ig-like domain-containing protein n=1 Tax=Mongoliibacter ruber TaxID=1750599 RepID=A0A2T0WSX1_9BACT|nr:Ig-like domain-containing domain [Mongoliibacter ruber]PRY89801.1 Ig-like domain-containing protein [Mongoliibacter ruber]